MKQLGAGWQYIAYDLGNGRVRKYPRHPLAQTVKIGLGLLYGRSLTYSYLRSEQQRATRSAQESVHLIQNHVPTDALWLFGNPVFDETNSYEQDKVKPLTEVLKRGDAELAVQLFEAYADLLEHMWSYGLSETSFNLMWNAGVDSSGRVVLLDFGELTADKDVVATQIRTQAWMQQYVFRYLKPELSAHLARIFNERLTIKRLDAVWDSNRRD